MIPSSKTRRTLRLLGEYPSVRSTTFTECLEGFVTIDGMRFEIPDIHFRVQRQDVTELTMTYCQERLHLEQRRDPLARLVSAENRVRGIKC